MAYEIVSDTDNGKITATVEMPGRSPAKSVRVRFRHPRATPMQSVRVKGQPWSDFHPGTEVIELKGLAGKVAIVATYPGLPR